MRRFYAPIMMFRENEISKEDTKSRRINKAESLSLENKNEGSEKQNYP